MVWAGSQRFGIGKARARSGKVIAVAHYQPKGTIPGAEQRSYIIARATFLDLCLKLINSVQFGKPKFRNEKKCTRTPILMFYNIASRGRFFVHFTFHGK
jgi:hypothetical protein